uniref:sensor histidine kinase n=1 Tax=uncultured Sphingomonas sp. TaxID=158754 RepID=UPI00260C7494
AMALRVLLDAAPTPLLAIEGDAVRALNRAARGMFATDNRVLPAPSLIDPAATRLLHEARTWRIDRVAMPDGRSVVALIDIEQEERTAEARAAADLIQVLGHELMNGLAPIVSLAESGIAALERPAIDTDLLHEILGTLSRRAEGLQRFTEAYRALARLPAPTRRLVRLGEMADDLARLFAGRWPGVALSVSTEAAEWALDRDQLCQALWALLQNAAEACVAMPLPQVALRIQVADHGLRIEVADNGPGVHPDRAHHIFRPFHTTKPGGTGVGLTLARQIVLGHGGLLTLQQAPGTVFQMLLPKER